MQRFEMAVWAESSNKCVDIPYSLDIHLNFLKFPQNNYLDIGVRLPNTVEKEGKNGIEQQVIDRLKIYINKKIKAENITDITDKFKDNETITMIFNEYIQDDNRSRLNEYCDIVEIGKEKFCFNYSQCDPITVSEFENGTLISITTNANEIKKYAFQQYKRIRIGGEMMHDLFMYKNTPDAFLEKYIKRLYFLDFRLNDIRCLSDRNVERIEYCHLNHVRMFLTIENCEEVTRCGEEYKGIRSLEIDKWKKYLPERKRAGIQTSDIVYMPSKSVEKEEKPILTYQWNKNNCKDFTLFVETASSTLKILRAIVYYGVALLIGVAGSVVASLMSTQKS